MRGVWTVWLLSGPGQSACNDDSFVLDLDTNWGSLNCVTAWRDSPEYAAVFLVFIDLDIDIIKGSDPDQSFKLQYHYMSNMKQSGGCAECAAVSSWSLQHCRPSYLGSCPRVTILRAGAGSLPRLSFNKRVSGSTGEFYIKFLDNSKFLGSV